MGYTNQMQWYKGAEDFMKEAGHEVDGRWFPRVTKILDVKSKSGLYGFYAEMGSIEAAEAVKNKSAEEGTLVHEVTQKLAVGESVEIPEEIRPSVEAFDKLMKEREIVFHPEYVERPVWSEFHRFSGTVDALASIDGKFGVLDIKTSTGFFPEYNLQTAAYVLALQEKPIKDTLLLPRDIETRWILRIDQHKVCKDCGSKLREKGGRTKLRPNGKKTCSEDEHQWGETVGDVALREFPYYFQDIKAFLAAKTLWEWENNYWLRQIGYSR
jgi:hypothetical protein